ncbi:MAG: KUP/HAK/KT family potassium transporter [Actinomycetota bacterium]
MPKLVSPAPRTHVGRPAAAAGSTLGALGVVFGDIGTSPLYAIQIAAPSLSGLVVPGAVAILTVLFAVQRWGTAAVGRVFGPVMALWFGALALVGAREVVAHPGIVKSRWPRSPP